jgi:TolA-binding protein
MFMAGQCLCIQKKFKESVSIHKAMISIYPQSKFAQHAYFRVACVTAGHLERVDEGIQLFTDFIKRFPKSMLSADCLFNVAALHLIQGKSSQAASEFALVFKMYPKSNRAESAKRNLIDLTKVK